MFGGVCYLLNGNMFCGVYRDFLILRLGEKGADEALGLEFARPFDITGRPMSSWVMIESEGFMPHFVAQISSAIFHSVNIRIMR